MKEEIMKILVLDRKSLPPGKRNLYTLYFVLFLIAHAFLFAYLGFHLSFGIFIIFGVMYCSAWLYLDSIIRKKKSKIMKNSWDSK